MIEVFAADLPMEVTYAIGLANPGISRPDPSSPEHWQTRIDSKTGETVRLTPGATLTEPARRYGARVRHPDTGETVIQIAPSLEIERPEKAEQAARKGIQIVCQIPERNAQLFATAWRRAEMTRAYQHELATEAKIEAAVRSLPDDADAETTIRAIQSAREV